MEFYFVTGLDTTFDNIEDALYAAVHEVEHNDLESYECYVSNGAEELIAVANCAGLRATIDAEEHEKAAVLAVHEETLDRHI